MGLALNTPLTIEVGEYSAFRATIQGPLGVEIPDVSDYRAVIRFAGPPANGVYGRALLELTTENGGILRDGPYFRWAITPAGSRALRTGVWQMVVISPSDHPTRIHEGAVTVRPEIRGGL
ncbi:hypothetical protein [Deinococcus aquiradiocola]|uniref:Uncharacterized protein n=1 Tax=Deinococcus aquiradiocola TaxID=393059 RepID=A0A917P7G0_9DEIO|nr:hypothetical protein [Deinococcus aquiradiocola]GGJ65458.1 hypothetical protein GCM10008939_06750 [Deinococcus aquiradiocola]